MIGPISRLGRAITARSGASISRRARSLHPILLDLSASSGSLRSYSTSNKSETEVKTESTAAESSSKDTGSEIPVEEFTEKEASLHKSLQEQKDAFDNAKDALRRLTADFENFQRISKRNITEATEKGVTRLASDLFDTLDTLKLALDSVPKEAVEPGTHLSNLHGGVKMTSDVLLKALKRHGIEVSDPTGESFNPNLHEALYMAPLPGKTPGSIIACSKLGFTYKGRALRPAQVGVVQEVES